MNQGTKIVRQKPKVDVSAKLKLEVKKKNYDHPLSLIISDIEKYLIPIYIELSKEDVLTRCLNEHKAKLKQEFEFYYLSPRSETFKFWLKNCRNRHLYCLMYLY